MLPGLHLQVDTSVTPNAVGRPSPGTETGIESAELLLGQ